MPGKIVLFWGRADHEYSRNRIVLNLFERLGWQAIFFRPLCSQLGLPQSLLSPPKRPDLIWVPSFRHSDIGSASYWAKKWHLPLIVDPFISVYGKKVLEREKWPVLSRNSQRLKKWEEGILGRADLVVADTAAHASFFQEELNVDPLKTTVLYVGAEDELFTYHPYPEVNGSYEIIFFGSYLKLHGVDTIIRAAASCRDLNVKWTLLGDSRLMEEIAKTPYSRNLSYEPWISYEKLPARIAKAHIALGIFGSSFQAARVIPNKVFQTMAVGRPLITSYCSAYDDNIGHNSSIGWVNSGDSNGLADLVRRWLKKPEELAAMGKQARELYEQFFSKAQLTKMLERALAKVDLL